MNGKSLVVTFGIDVGLVVKGAYLGSWRGGLDREGAKQSFYGGFKKLAKVV